MRGTQSLLTQSLEPITQQSTCLNINARTVLSCKPASPTIKIPTSRFGAGVKSFQFLVTMVSETFQQARLVQVQHVLRTSIFTIDVCREMMVHFVRMQTHRSTKIESSLSRRTTSSTTTMTRISIFLVLSRQPPTQSTVITDGTTVCGQ